MLYKLGKDQPIIDGDFFVAENATVLGKVKLSYVKILVYGLELP